MKFLKKGEEGVALTQRAEKDTEARKAASGNKTFRFWMPDGAETKITFLDGDLSDANLLDVPMRLLLLTIPSGLRKKIHLKSTSMNVSCLYARVTRSNA